MDADEATESCMGCALDYNPCGTRIGLALVLTGITGFLTWRWFKRTMESV